MSLLPLLKSESLILGMRLTKGKIGILDQNLFKEGEDDNDNFKLIQPRGYKEEHNFALN